MSARSAASLLILALTGCSSEPCDVNRVQVTLSFPDEGTRAAIARLRFLVRQSGAHDPCSTQGFGSGPLPIDQDDSLFAESNAPVIPGSPEGPYMLLDCGAGSSIVALADNDSVDPFVLGACVDIESHTPELTIELR